MDYRLLTMFFVLVLAVGCGEKVEPTKEAILLQGKSPDEVLYTFEAIVAMSDSELTEKTNSLRERLNKKRSSMPSSAAGASIGGGSEGEKVDESTEADEPLDPDADVSVEFLALPFEVMQQQQELRK